MSQPKSSGSDQDAEHGHDEQTTSNAEGTSPNEAESTAGRDPVRRVTLIVLTVLLLLFVWYMLADRHAPYTDQARVIGFTVPIAPKVSGKIKKVNVVDNQVVEAGDLLVKIDPREYELALQRAEAELTTAGQETGADTAGVKAAEASLGKARAQLQQAQQEFERIERIYKEDAGAISAATRDRAKTQLGQATSNEANAVAELERAKERLGKGGEENPRVRRAAAALEQARINLAETKVYAPSTGGITNLKIDEGYYAKKGQPIMTFVSFSDIWIQANLRENSMANIQMGDEVDIALDQLPGRVFKGKVISKGFAVAQPSYGATGQLMKIKGDTGWLRDAQRFPVIIHFADESAYGYRLSGGQADVQVYGRSSIMNAMGWVWIRFMSLMSYIY